MPALNTTARPIRFAPPPSPLSAEGFALLGLQAAIMADRRSAKFFDTRQLAALAELCRAKASSLRARAACA